jgi:hypothetical protein
LSADYTDFFGSLIPAGKSKSNRKVPPFGIYLSEQNTHEATFLDEHSALKDRYHLKIICVICVICGKNIQPSYRRLREGKAPSINEGTDPVLICEICEICG